MTAQTPESRYAIYFVPDPATDLYKFGASVLGYDTYTGRDLALPDDVDRELWMRVVHEPRNYGFHATLKAPFYLLKGIREFDLVQDFLEFAHAQPAVLVGDLAIEELGSFIAFVPTAPRVLLNRLADVCVRHFDRVRAPMTAAERERRLLAGLTDRQRANTEQWGYPYIFEDFRFHMSLTGALPPPLRQKVLHRLRDKAERIQKAMPVTIDRLVIARQTSDEPFQVIRHAALGQSPYRPYAYTS